MSYSRAYVHQVELLGLLWTAREDSDRLKFTSYDRADFVEYSFEDGSLKTYGDPIWGMKGNELRKAFRKFLEENGSPSGRSCKVSFYVEDSGFLKVCR